jgi:hypothetical protein
MTKITLEQIVGYLPYGLICKMKLGPYYDEELSKLNTENIWHVNNDYSGIIKPILRPLSDLTKEIEVNGEKFVPIVELSKISEKRFSKLIECKESESGYFVGFIGTDEQRFSFAYFHKTKSFLLHSTLTTSIGNSVYPANQLEMFNKLYEWHFDIHNLIEQGLAIDINTLDD